MARTKQLVLLSLWLCIMFYHVDATNVQLLANGYDMSGRLVELKKRMADLETEVAQARTRLEKYYLEMDLQKVRASVARLESTLRVPYKDYVESLSGQRKEFEKEKAYLRKMLAEAEDKRLKAVDALASEQKKKGLEVATYMTALTKATIQRNKIADEYAKFTETYYEEEEKMKQERDQFLTQKEKLQQTLDGAKKKHSKVLEALSATPTEGYIPIRIPEQDEINKLREDITAFNGLADRKKLKEGLETTRTKLQELLNKLYQAGKFSSKAARGDIEKALRELEKSAMVEREEKANQRKGLVEKMKKEDLTNYDVEEIASLKKANEEMAASDMLQKEIARRSAYLKGVVEVSDLIKECSNAIRDANERNLANLWADAIQEAADSPLGSLWAEALQEAMDSELAKAWADTIKDAKSSELAKVWTNAIEEVKDINLSEVWTDVVQNLKNSPLGKMWSDTIKNAKDSPFTKDCANALESAKNSFCEIILKFNNQLK